MRRVYHNMAERKNFLLLAMGVGAVCVAIGAYTIWNVVSDVLQP